MRLLLGPEILRCQGPCLCQRDESEWIHPLMDEAAVSERGWRGSGLHSPSAACWWPAGTPGLGRGQQLHHHVLLLLTEALAGPGAAPSSSSGGSRYARRLPEPCMVASPLCLSRSGVWQLDLKSFLHSTTLAGAGGGAESGGLALLTQCLGRAGCLVPTRAESTPSVFSPSRVLGQSLLLSNGGSAKSHVSSAVPPDRSSRPQNHSSFCNDLAGAYGHTHWVLRT